MIFDIDKIIQGGLEFNLNLTNDQIHIDHSACDLNNQVNINAKLDRINKDVYLSGCVKAELQLICSRCLGRSIFFVNAKLFTHFVPKEFIETPYTEREIQKEDLETEYYSENQINISNSVRDAILLDLPMVGLCKDSCLGLCDLCGKDLNNGPCNCSREPEFDPRLQVLEKIKNKIY